MHIARLHTSITRGLIGRGRPAIAFGIRLARRWRSPTVKRVARALRTALVGVSSGRSQSLGLAFDTTVVGGRSHDRTGQSRLAGARVTCVIAGRADGIAGHVGCSR